MKPRAETVGEDRGPGEMLRRPNLDSASFLDGTRNDRRVGMWSARALFGIGVCYAMTVVAGFIALGNFRDPLADPYVTIAEVLIIAMAPVMVLLMAAATHVCTPLGTRVWRKSFATWIGSVQWLWVTFFRCVNTQAAA